MDIFDFDEAFRVTSIEEIEDRIMNALIAMEDEGAKLHQLVRIIALKNKIQESLVYEAVRKLMDKGFIFRERDKIFLNLIGKESNNMWAIINEVIARGTMTGVEISEYSRNVLGREKKSAGGCIARAIEYGYLEIIDVEFVNGKATNVYAYC